MRSLLVRIWHLLTEPSPRVQAREGRRHARALAIFILLGVLSSPAVLIFHYEAIDSYRSAEPYIRLLLIPSIAAYCLSRTRYYLSGLLLEGILIWSGVVITVIVKPGDLVSICFLGIPVLFCAAVFDQRMTWFTSVFTLLTDAVLVWLTPEAERINLVGSQVFLLFAIGLVLYIQRNQALLQIERQAALDAAEANHKTLLAKTFDGVALCDQGRVIEADEGFSSLFGLNVGEIIYNPLLSLFPIEEHDRLDDLIRVGSGRPIELRVEHTAAMNRWIEIVCQRQLDSRGEPMEILAARDVTERKTMQQQVLLTGRMVAMGTLAAGVAHEINNPLTYIMGHQQLLGREMKPLLQDSPAETKERIQHRLQIIRDGVDRVKHIVSDLKTFSRSEDEKIAVVQLKHIAETAIQMTWNEIRHRAQLVREFDTAPPVEASAAHLSQVVINLLVNAAQALPEDSSDRMRVTLSIGTTDEGWAYLSVSDTGPGIPPEHLQRIFEPFYTTKPVGEGTGLGLSICHNLVQRYDGEITVQSSIEGTSFRVLLPPTTRALPSTEAAGNSGHAPIPSSRRVLVVDDEPEIAQLLKEMLFDFDVCIAENGQAAIDRWTSEDFDIMVCDLMMPKVSGMDVYQAIQNAAPGEEQQILFITGGAFTPATRAFLESLEKPCLQKPFSPHELRQMVIEMGMAQGSQPPGHSES